jgi:hypothetical protein
MVAFKHRSSWRSWRGGHARGLSLSSEARLPQGRHPCVPAQCPWVRASLPSLRHGTQHKQQSCNVTHFLVLEEIASDDQKTSLHGQGEVHVRWN